MYVLVCVDDDGEPFDPDDIVFVVTDSEDRDYGTTDRSEATIFSKKQAEAFQLRNMNPEPKVADLSKVFEACEYDYSPMLFVKINNDFHDGGEFVVKIPEDYVPKSYD